MTTMIGRIGMFGAITFYQVDPGTEVECNLTHQKLIVTDDVVVFGGGRAWVTPKIYQALKDDPRSTINSALKERK